MSYQICKHCCEEMVMVWDYDNDMQAFCCPHCGYVMYADCDRLAQNGDSAQKEGEARE